MSLRKHLIDSAPRAVADDGLRGESWLDMARSARVEVTSEDSAHPVEAALLPGSEAGWRAGQPGEQIIRLIFDRPQHLRRIDLLFVEPEHTRMQEFVLRWSAAGRAFQDIVRQQWNFSPSGSVREAEAYQVDLSGVTVLELMVIPDVSGGAARASLARWRVATRDSGDGRDPV